VPDLPANQPPNRPRPQPREKTEPKTENKPETPAPVEQPPAPPQPPASPLRTPSTANDNEAAGTVRATIDRGRGFLASVDFGMLSNERKKAYNDAKMFLDQAESALKQGNYAFALGVANKGETLARDLAGK
jgi:outer membrane biosynthesis protein TonB